MLDEIKPQLYRNKLKNRFLTRRLFKILSLERATIAEGKAQVKTQDFEVKPTWSKTDSSGCFDIELDGQFDVEKIYFVDVDGQDFRFYKSKILRQWIE